MLLSAALITRDEEHHLPDCLASLVDVVDEIIVVDTGSVDATPSIARSFGAVVIDHPWQGDFAAARNAGLAHARGEWILYIDADERFSVEGDLRAALGDPQVVAGLVRFRAASAYTRYLEYRMFRNRPDVRFRGSMHETLLPDLIRVMETEDVRAEPVPASIEHLGYEGDQTAKHRRNLPLLEQEILEDPQRNYLWFHLGVVRRALGDATGAEDAWAQAVEISRSRGAITNTGLLAYVELALHRLRTDRSAADIAAELERERPDDPLTTWVMAGQAMFEQRWRDAIPLLESMVAIDAAALVHKELAYNVEIFGGQALHALGNCWFQLGDDTTAAELFARAEQSDPDNDAYRVKRQLAEARLARR